MKIESSVIHGITSHGFYFNSQLGEDSKLVKVKEKECTNWIFIDHNTLKAFSPRTAYVGYCAHLYDYHHREYFLCIVCPVLL